MANPALLVAKSMLDEIMKKTSGLLKEMLSFRGLEKDVKILSSELSSIKCMLEGAENKPQLKDWLGKLKEAAFDAEDVLETFAAETSLGKASSQCDTVHKIINDILKRVEMIAKAKDTYHIDIQYNGGRSDTPNYTGHVVDKSAVVGREADQKSITDMMLSNAFDKEGGVSVIPIIGMGGLGKTALARLVFNDERVSAHFKSRIWVCVTVKFDLTRILKEMIQSHSKMKLESDDSSTSHLQSRLQEFMRGQLFLLVLDDVWTEDSSEWGPLLDLLKQLGAKGSRVLVTSRNTRLGDVIGTQPSYRLQYLPEDKCWSLFAKIAFGNIGTTLSSETRKELEDIGGEIVRKCQGLPLAVKAMGELLRGHIDVSKWRQIQSSEIWEIEDQDPAADKLKVMAILKLSYDHLRPAYDLMRCFEYCSLFPKSHVFYKEELVKLWIAQGFIQSSGSKTMEEAGNEYFRELLIRSFFQHSSIDNKEIFSMHDLIHDLARAISRPNFCQVKGNELCGFSEQSRHVSLLGKDVEQPMLEIVKNTTKLRTLLLPDSIEADSSGHLKSFGKALDKVFDTLKYMRVLDLSSSQIKELPDSIEELKLLRYLNLSRTEIRLLPNSICNLINLQTLKLLGCVWLSGLPKNLGNLVNLRHLELDDSFWFELSMLPPSMGNLTSLHNLPVFQVGHENGYGIEQLEKMTHLSGKLHISKLEKAVNAGAAKLNEKKSLDKLVFEWSENRVVNRQDEATENSVLEALQPHISNLKELQIIRYRGNEFPAWMKEEKLEKLVILTLNGCIKCKTLALDKLPNLRELYIKGLQELEKWAEVELYSLRLLKLSNCPELKDLPRIFPNLDYLKIKSCNSLIALPMVPYLKILILIDNLILENWNEAVVLDYRQSEMSVHFTELLELKVISCPKLQALPRFFRPQKLEISRCFLPDTSISNISSLPKWTQLPGLKALYIRDCKDLVSLWNGEDGSLRTLTSLKLLSIRNCEMLETLNEELPTALECLSIVSCPRLNSLGAKEILKNLPSLKDLYIEDCPMLQSMPEDGYPSSLRHLQIKTCPLLTEECQTEGGGDPDWPRIAHIPDLEIDNSHIVVSSTSLANPSVPSTSAANPPVPSTSLANLRVPSTSLANPPVPSTSAANPPVPSTSLANPPVPSTSVANRPFSYRHFLCCRGIDTNDIGGANERPN